MTWRWSCAFMLHVDTKQGLYQKRKYICCSLSIKNITQGNNIYRILYCVILFKFIMNNLVVVHVKFYTNFVILPVIYCWYFSENYYKLELEKKKSRISKQVYKGPIIRYHSVTMPLIEDITPDLEVNVDEERWIFILAHRGLGEGQLHSVCMSVHDCFLVSTDLISLKF